MPCGIIQQYQKGERSSMTVNGNPNWTMRSATSLNDLYTGAVIACSHSPSRNLKMVQKPSIVEDRDSKQDTGRGEIAETTEV